MREQQRRGRLTEKPARAHDDRAVVAVAQLHRHRTSERGRRRRGAHLARPRRDVADDALGRTPRHERGAVIPGAALTEEAQLLVVGVILAAQLAKTRGQFEVALAVELEEFTARDAVQHQRVFVEAFGDARDVEVGERSDRM